MATGYLRSKSRGTKKESTKGLTDKEKELNSRNNNKEPTNGKTNSETTTSE